MPTKSKLKEITEQANAHITSQLTTAERRGAVAELRRLADEWQGTHKYWQAANAARDRADELEREGK